MSPSDAPVTAESPPNSTSHSASRRPFAQEQSGWSRPSDPFEAVCKPSDPPPNARQAKRIPTRRVTTTTDCNLPQSALALHLRASLPCCVWVRFTMKCNRQYYYYELAVFCRYT
eukprot:540438-Rhodomonas_salina.2